MTWTADEWDGFAHLLQEWWANDLPDGARVAWKLALDEVRPVEAVAVLKGLLRRGGTWRPTVAEFVAALDHQRAGGVRSFDEAWPAIQRAMRSLRPGDDGRRAVELVRDLAGEHAAGWLASYGVWRLAYEPVDDPDYGGAVMHRLRENYTEITRSPQSRDRLSRALTDRPRRGELRKVDAVAALPEAAA